MRCGVKLLEVCLERKIDHDSMSLSPYSSFSLLSLYLNSCFRAVQEGMRTYYFQTDTSEQMLA